jgi:hypothetical protein
LNKCIKNRADTQGIIAQKQEPFGATDSLPLNTKQHKIEPCYFDPKSSSTNIIPKTIWEQNVESARKYCQTQIK